MLETLFLNIPTLISFDKNHIRLNADSIKNYKILEKVGILHYTRTSLINQIEFINQDIQNWWNLKKTVMAKNLFLDKYCYTDPAWKEKFIVLINDDIN